VHHQTKSEDAALADSYFGASLTPVA
jgi:hypothetical protein